MTHFPVAALQLPTLHASFKPEQSTAAPVWHCSVCWLHVSTPLQGFPSLQSALVAQAHAEELLVQPPSFSEQLSAVHEMPSLHVTAVPLHLPALQLSAVVQVKPSLQVLPSPLAGLVHRPVCWLHVPTAWQLSRALHTTDRKSVV